ncbi:UbiD family decarboxylase domain-containing protein [Chloroflexota bacterium]
MVITRDPDEGCVNLGTYRVMLHDKDTLGFYISPGHHGRIMREKYWSRGESCPVAVSFGQDPLLWTASVTTLKWGASEYDFAGYLKGEPVEIMRGPLTGLPIPARAEIVIEGEAPPPEVETRIEGPFGEWTGYYGHGARPEPVIKVKAVYHRNDPILQGNPPNKAPLISSAFPAHLSHSAHLWNEMEVAGITGIRGVYIPPFAPGKLGIISLKQQFHGHAKKAGLVAAANSYTTTFRILVDDDIDPSNIEDVLWAVVTRCDPETSLNIVGGTMSSALDPQMSPEKKGRGDFTSSVLIIDACRPFHRIKEFPPVNKLSDGMRQKMLGKWGKALATIIRDQKGPEPCLPDSIRKVTML